MSVTHGYYGASPGLVRFRLLDKEVIWPSLTQVTLLLVGWSLGSNLLLVVWVYLLILSNLKKKNESEGCFQHKVVMTAQWITVQ